MIKKLLSITALGLVATFTASALLSGNTNFSAVVNQARQVAPVSRANVSEAKSEQVAMDYARLQEEALSNKLGSAVAVTMKLENPQLPDAFAEPTVTAEFCPSLRRRPPWPPARARLLPPKVPTLPRTSTPKALFTAHQ